MTQDNTVQPPPPPQPPAPPQQSPAEVEELKRIRSGNRILKIVAGVLASLFLLTAGSAFYVYRKVTQAKTAIAEAFASLPPIAAPGGAEGGTGSLPQGGLGLSGAGQPGGSSLDLVSGGVPGALPGGMTAEDGERTYNALMKYEKRPIVQEFIADLKKNPDMAKAFAEAGAGAKGNPLAVISSIRNAKGMETMLAKYIHRPEFLRLMNDVMRDPELRGLMSGAQSIAAGAQQPGAVRTQAMPVEPEPSRGEEAAEEPRVLDPAAISGGAQEAGPRRAYKKPPPPVDSD